MTTKTRHSYVQFYPSDWAAGCASLPPLVEWAYFQVCRYNWDKVKPMPAGQVPLILSRDPNWLESIDMLIDAGMLDRSSSGDLSNVRALLEAQRANRLWEAKSKAGSKGGKSQKNKSQPNQYDKKQRLSNDQADINVTATEPEPEPEPDDDDKSSSSVDDDLINFSIRVCRAAGVRHMEPGIIIRNHDIIAEWQSLGLSNNDIIQVVSECVGRTKDTISSLKYFDQAIRKSVALREGSHGKPSGDRTLNAADRAIAEIEAEIGASGSGSANGDPFGIENDIDSEPHKRRAVGNDGR